VLDDWHAVEDLPRAQDDAGLGMLEKICAEVHRRREAHHRFGFGSGADLKDNRDALQGRVRRWLSAERAMQSGSIRSKSKCRTKRREAIAAALTSSTRITWTPEETVKSMVDGAVNSRRMCCFNLSGESRCRTRVLTKAVEQTRSASALK